MIRVLVTACTSGPLLVAQGRALERHMACAYELVVVNDAKDEPHFSNMWQAGKAAEIAAAASEVGARHVRFPQEWHTDRRRVFPDEPAEWADVENANTRCADAVQYGVDLLLGESDEPFLILDADMVPFKTFDPSFLLETLPVWGVPQTRSGVVYLWNGLILVDPEQANAMSLFNLDCVRNDAMELDVGGMLYPFVAANKDRIGSFAITSAEAHVEGIVSFLPEDLFSFFCWDVIAQGEYRLSETYGEWFAHLGGGGNWEVRDQGEALERVRRFVEALS